MYEHQNGCNKAIVYTYTATSNILCKSPNKRYDCCSGFKCRNCLNISLSCASFPPPNTRSATFRFPWLKTILFVTSRQEQYSRNRLYCTVYDMGIASDTTIGHSCRKILNRNNPWVGQFDGMVRGSWFLQS